MKTLKLASLFTPILLVGCASTTGTVPIDANTAIGTATNVGTAIFQSAVDQKCRSELTGNQYYKLASVALSDQQKTTLQDNVCGCVTQNAMQNVNIVDIATAATNASARTQLVTKAVTGTLQTCVGQVIK